MVKSSNTCMRDVNLSDLSCSVSDSESDNDDNEEKPSRSGGKRKRPKHSGEAE